MTATLADFPLLRAWWETGAAAADGIRYGYRFFHIAGTEHDQLVPDGVSNPYWDVVRFMPSTHDLYDGIAPYPYARGTGITRQELTTRYSWAIPSPGDIAWIAGTLDGQAVVEVGAGSGYWAWQLAQAGVNVVAYEPNDPADNTFVKVAEPYHPLLRDDASAAVHHPDRALFLSWPNYDQPWATQALAAYRGDLLIYAGEGEGGCCADDAFFELLDAEWSEVDQSPHRLTWWGIHCRLTAYRRSEATPG